MAFMWNFRSSFQGSAEHGSPSVAPQFSELWVGGSTCISSHPASQLYSFFLQILVTVIGVCSRMCSAQFFIQQEAQLEPFSPLSLGILPRGTFGHSGNLLTNMPNN